MVGSRRLELPTSSVSRKRSNQLSYEPTNGGKAQYTNQSVIETMVPGEFPSSRLFTKMNAGRPSTRAISISSRSPCRTGSFTSCTQIRRRELPHRIPAWRRPRRSNARATSRREVREFGDRHPRDPTPASAPGVVDMGDIARAQTGKIIRLKKFGIANLHRIPPVRRQSRKESLKRLDEFRASVLPQRSKFEDQNTGLFPVRLQRTQERMPANTSHRGMWDSRVPPTRRSGDAPAIPAQ